MKNLPRKRRTREHIIADLSVNHVERQLLLCGFTCDELRRDYARFRDRILEQLREVVHDEDQDAPVR
jgi:hypothetical protein